MTLTPRALLLLSAQRHYLHDRPDEREVARDWQRHVEQARADGDLIALVQDSGAQTADDVLQVKRLRVVCGTEGPQEAELTLSIEGVDHSIDATGDGPVDAAFHAVKMLYPHKARLQLYQVQAVTEGSSIRAGSELMPEGGDLEPGPQLYGQILAQMAGTISDCLSA